MQVQQILDKMIALSRRKFEELTALKNLSEKQIKAFHEQQLDNVEILLDKKDEIINYIRKLDDVFLRVYDTLKEKLGIDSVDMISGVYADKGKELKDLISKITEVVEHVIQLEQNNYGIAVNLQKHLGDKIKEINAGKKATTAYNIKPVNSPSYFIDKKK